MILNPKIFAGILIGLDILAGIGYIQSREVGRVLYWFSAAVLTYSVTWLIK
jgi:hypothetical protein